MNDFQIWLVKKGYTRNYGALAWRKEGELVNAGELREKLNEFNQLKDK